MKSLITVIIYALFITYLLGAVLFFIGNKFSNKQAQLTASLMAGIGLVLNIGALIVRGVIAGRLPLASGGEFILWFTVMTVALYLYYETKTKMKETGGAVMLISALLIGSILLLMKGQLGEALPLMPALKSPWLTIHVLTAAIAYACFALAAGLAIMQIARVETKITDEMIYRIVAGGFIMLSFAIVFGAIWAEQAWGSYWSWDPKETWALITWIIYALYLHLHRRFGWKGKTASIMVIAGFVLVLFTFFGVNYLMTGLHSYA